MSRSFLDRCYITGFSGYAACADKQVVWHERPLLLSGYACYYGVLADPLDPILVNAGFQVKSI